MPGYRKGDVFYAGLISREIVNNLDLHPLVFTPSSVHPEEHFYPVLGLSSPCSCIDCQNGISLVIRISEQGLKFEPPDGPLNRSHIITDLFQR